LEGRGKMAKRGGREGGKNNVAPCNLFGVRYHTK
jgi:hypothetical protein